MHHTKSTVAERPPLSVRFIATEWFRGVGYALVTLFGGGVLYLGGRLAIMGADELIRGQEFDSVDTLMQAVFTVALAVAGVMGIAAVGAKALDYPGLAALFGGACRWLFVLGVVTGLFLAIHFLFFSPHHCNCLGGPR
ncbi:hypothetical protein I1S38_22165 [Serratia ureilytica]|uniref:hypothetical protein n=1 Tax=Serratia TaxID=613 RepID=UPI0011F27F4B|nr:MULTISPECIES: hypothetical protein [Serratia]MBF4185592.1 hypothetical protein [Serratia ureilytica]MBF8442468.1 hypothetical protein [Serratia ureilytica]MBF8447353.1 hypothetical protein [Serratia ureilytica]